MIADLSWEKSWLGLLQRLLEAYKLFMMVSQQGQAVHSLAGRRTVSLAKES